MKRRLHTLSVGERVAASPCGLSGELRCAGGAAGLSHRHGGARTSAEPVLVTVKTLLTGVHCNVNHSMNSLANSPNKIPQICNRKIFAN